MFRFSVNTKFGKDKKPIKNSTRDAEYAAGRNFVTQRNAKETQRVRATKVQSWWVPNHPFAYPGVAEKAPWRSLQSGVAGVYSLLEKKNPTDSYHFPSHSTPSSDPNSNFARKALSATSGLAPGGLSTRQVSVRNIN